MKTLEELFAALGNRGEYAALPHVTLDEVKMIYAEGAKGANERPLSMESYEVEESVINKLRRRRDAGRSKYGCTMERTDLTRIQWLIHAQEEAMDLSIYLERLVREEATQGTAVNKLRTAINEAIAISGTGTPQDWTNAQVGLCRVLEEVKVMLGEK